MLTQVIGLCRLFSQTAITPQGDKTMTKFQAGKTYFTRSVADADCIIKITIDKRTPSTIVTTDGKRLKVKEWNGVEQVKPWGSYSMAPIISADRLA